MVNEIDMDETSPSFFKKYFLNKELDFFEFGLIGDGHGTSIFPRLSIEVLNTSGQSIVSAQCTRVDVRYYRDKKILLALGSPSYRDVCGRSPYIKMINMGYENLERFTLTGNEKKTLTLPYSDGLNKLLITG